MGIFVKIIISCVLFSACTATKSPAGDDVPLCIRDMITKFKAEQKQNPVRSITEYIWEGKRVYYVTSPCCDQFNAVYDSTCTYMGAPDGGITGKGDGKLPGFAGGAKNARVVWRDER